MKATGIVRRIDELGRVVIPKEIRSTLRLKSGDPLEIFTERDELMLKKYSPIASLGQFSCGTAKSLNDISGHLAVICDTDEIICASGSGRRELAGKTISRRLDDILKERKSYVASLCDGGDIVPLAEEESASPTAQVIVPIVCGGDCLGAVALLSYEQGARMESGRYLNQLLENVENNIQQADGEYEDRIRHLKEDYITRAQAAAYILTETSEADAAAAQSFGHPQRTFSLLVNAVNDSAQITRASLRGLYLNRENILTCGRNVLKIRLMHVGIKQYAHFAGKTANAEAIRTVGGKVYFDSAVIKLHVLMDIHTDRSILRKLDNAVRLFGHAKFSIRAKHAAGINAAKLCRLNRNAGKLGTDQGNYDLKAFSAVRSTADNLQKLTCARINLGYVQVIGIRMVKALDNFTYDDFVKFSAHGRNGINLKTCHGDHVRKFICA